MKTNRKCVTWICAVQLIALCICCLVCTILHISDAIPELISIFVILIGSLVIFTWLKTMGSGLQLSIIFSGYLLRIVCMLFDLFGRDYFTVLHSGSDSEGFFEMAALYYSGDYSGYYTWYPYVLRAIFSIFGQNRIIAQYVNILFWVFTVFLVLKICGQFHVPKRNRFIACGMLSFLPNSIFLSSILLRESMMIFFDLWGMYYIMRWMKNGKLSNLFLAFIVSAPAIILHTASIGVWAAFALVVAIWNNQRQKYVVTMKAGVVMAGFAILVCILYFTDLKMLFMTKFDEGFSIYSITHRHFGTGGSDYLTNMDYQHWYEFVPFTLIRMFYFVFSPIPTECRGLMDYLCILGDVLPTVFIMFSICFNIRRKRAFRYMLVGILSYVIIVGIFAWGTANAGTAIRHRGMLWGILIATYCIGFVREDSKHDFTYHSKTNLKIGTGNGAL